jgi:hypothetical protein
MSIYKIQFEPFLAEEVDNVNDVSWQWVPDTHCYVVMDSLPTCLDDLTEAEFLVNEEEFFVQFDRYCLADEVTL